MKKIKFTKETFALSLILILSAILNFSNLSIEGYANQYYAAGVKSMTMSLKNFFFVSFDPAGFVTIDKPPLGFWIQAISAKIFGFSGWSIILPQALAGVISVALIYHIVKKSFGTSAGLISSLCLAVTPIFVAVSRNNTVDNLLVLTLLFACMALQKAAEKGKLKYLIVSLVLMGVGFNIKMLQAYMIAPALYITYLLSSSVSIKKRIAHLTLGTLVLLLVSLSWASVVDLVPKESRPFIGSSTNNTVMELIAGHNGLERLGIGGIGIPKGRQQRNDGQGSGQFRNVADSISNGTQGQPPQGMTGVAPNNDGPRGMGPGIGDKNMQPPNRGGFGGTFGGEEKASITRLFSKNSLSDQISWFLPIAVFGFIAAAIKEKLKSPFDNQRKLSLVLWFMWLLPAFIYFSYTKGLFHPYYLTMIAPPIAALAGIGAVTMWQLYKEAGWKSWILPMGIIVNGLVQILILSYYYDISSISKAITIALSALCFTSSIILIVINLSNNQNTKLKKILAGISLIGLLIAPTAWSFTTIFYPMSGTFPSAGLGLIPNRRMENFSGDNTTKLIEFLRANKSNEKYLLVVPSAMNYASEIIIKTGEPVMTLGGFSGSDKIITLSQFKQLVNEGVVRYAIVSGGGPDGNNEITNWIKENGKLVSENEWGGSSNINDGTSNSDNKNPTELQGQRGFEFGGRNQIELYDLKGSVSSSM
jgi:4-amino-4-deoxy-L-arabinose transferase-like glycosyltransferase